VRILIVHSHYSAKSPSGENVAVHQHAEALAKAGLEVITLSRYTDLESQRFSFSLRSATHAITGFDTQGAEEKVMGFSPDIINVHNLSPNFGTRWIKRLRVPTVLTLHNFRFTCANGLLFRDGKICTKCVVGSSFNATKHSCFQQSRFKSLPWSLGETVGSSLGSNLRHFSLLIAQTPKVKEILEIKGVNSDQIFLVPGFVEEKHESVTEPPAKSRFVFVGRHTPEKGLDELLRNWPNDFALDVIGTEQLDAVTGLETSNVRYLGQGSRDWVRSLLPKYSGLVFPGKCFEGAVPLVIREALEAGVPVLAQEGSAAEPVVLTGESGVVFRERDRNSLESAIRMVDARGAALRFAARRQYESEMTEAAWLHRTLTLYKNVLSSPFC